MKKLMLLLTTCFVLFAGFGVVFAQELTFSGVASCSGCHGGGPGGDQFPFWAETAHATAFDSASAFVQATATCLQCHTTGWDTTAANLGADDFVTINGDGSVTVDDQTEFDKKTNVQCESCHGPASGHVSNVFATGELPPRSGLLAAAAENCGTCHQDEHHPFIEEWSESKHAVSDTNASAFLQGRFRNDPNCSGCHTYQGFLQFVGTTSEDTTNVFPDVVAPGDESLPIVCATCHDPHDAKHPGQLRLPVADLCAKCHNPEDAQPPDNPHHSTASMFDGVGAAAIPGVSFVTQSPHQFLPLLQEKKCAACHVFMTGFVDENNPAKTGHTFEPRIEGCMQAGCHESGLVDTGMEEFNHRGRQTEIRGLIDSLANIIADIEMNVLPAASPSDSADYQIGLFNLRFASNEGSNGVHNTNYARSILENTIAFLDTALITSVEPIPDAGLPLQFSLGQNYPNPFNPTTTIRFDVPKTTHVKIVVYNSLGQEVATLVDEQLTPRSYTVDFGGSDLSSGLYFYRIVTSEFAMTRKMVLLK